MTMSQSYNDNIKRPEPQNTQLGILKIPNSKIYSFCQEIQQRASDPRQSAAGITQYLSLRIYPKA